MAGSRQPGPTGYEGVTVDVNDGTLTRQASHRAGPVGAGHSRHPGATHLRLVIFPGEMTTSGGGAIGHIYIVGGKGEAYEMAGGPPPGKGYRDRGGHTAGETPAGDYVLDHQEHHTSENWPKSVIPWGAKLREHGGEVQYQVGGQWHTATGAHGTVTQATVKFYARSGQHVALAGVVEIVRKLFYQPNGTLRSTWDQNDFGVWSWNLKKHGARTVYYIHTTPEDEGYTAAHQAFNLSQSHGCIHIRPADRDEMMSRGYLHAGLHVEVRPYGQHGPP